MPSGATSSGRWRELRRRGAGGLENQHVLEGVGEVILPANDVADAQIGIVGAGGQVVGRHAVAAQQGEIFDIGGGFRLLAVDRDRRSAPRARVSRGTRKRSANGSPAAARRSLSSRGISRISALNSQVPCAPDFSLSVPLRGREIAIGQPFWKIASATGAVQSQALGLLVLLVPAEIEPAQPFENGIDGDARYCAPTSVSSMRRIIVPPLWRAYSQLKMKVRALPMCRNPVGEGAKRTRSMGNASIARGAEQARRYHCIDSWRTYPGDR